MPGQPELGGRGSRVPLGTARAYARVNTNDPTNPSFQGNVGFPDRPRRVGVGHLCIPALQGVNVDRVPAVVSLAGGAIGFVTTLGTNPDCRSGEYEVYTADKNGYFADQVLFTILVP
jgi:hypothetical protein